ncbi:hypothetical protein Mapa_000455 [Marchantia paleacea]|nr:hypothetical protein Mapa_000455 [Marchantia paleacea]
MDRFKVPPLVCVYIKVIPQGKTGQCRARQEKGIIDHRLTHTVSEKKCPALPADTLAGIASAHNCPEGQAGSVSRWPTAQNPTVDRWMDKSPSLHHCPPDRAPDLLLLLQLILPPQRPPMPRRSSTTQSYWQFGR